MYVLHKNDILLYIGIQWQPQSW